MFNPVVIPLPLALALIVVLAAAALAYRNWLESATLPPWPPTSPTPTTPAPRPRHRLGDVAEPYRPRDWATVAAERLHREHAGRFVMVPTGATPTEIDVLAAEVMEIAAGIEKIRERDGNGMWSGNAPLVIEPAPPTEIVEVAGHPDQEPVEPGPLHVPGDIEDTRELVTVQ